MAKMNCCITLDWEHLVISRMDTERTSSFIGFVDNFHTSGLQLKLYKLQVNACIVVIILLETVFFYCCQSQQITKIFQSISKNEVDKKDKQMSNALAVL